MQALLLWGLCTFLIATHCSCVAMLSYLAASRQETSSELHFQAQLLRGLQAVRRS